MEGKKGEEKWKKMKQKLLHSVSNCGYGLYISYVVMYALRVRTEHNEQTDWMDVKLGS